MSKRIFFYAVEDDLQRVLAEVESGGELNYAPIATSDTKAVPVYNSASEIENLSEATCGTGSMSRSFLIADAGTNFVSERTKKDDGSIVYKAYEAYNPECIRIIPAGRWNDMLLSGTVVALHNDASSKRLMRRINAGFKKSGFEKVSGHWLGPNAYSEFKNGKRLGDAEQSPPEYDFRATF